ncbi:MAG TPA: hypothetical protein VN325_02425 [Steroidobacteraceae bacterium]|nr:hypothetical protein [Steroidobacteraceae bacterium]
MSITSRRLIGVVALLLGFATASWAVQAPLPWSFVNGAGKGYSIKLISSSPEPGAGLHPGQSVEFKVDLSYTLEVTDEGSIVLVFQDDSDKSLKPGSTQQHVDVKRGAGSVTLQDTLVVPEGVKEIRLFIPIVPKGMSKTSGEMILRYPVVTEVHSSTIGYPTVEAALKDLHSHADVEFREEHGWTTANDTSHNTVWSFPPVGNPAYPSAVKRMAVQDGKGVSMKMDVLCQASQSACDKLVEDFNALNERVRQSMQQK